MRIPFFGSFRGRAYMYAFEQWYFIKTSFNSYRVIFSFGTSLVTGTIIYHYFITKNKYQPQILTSQN